MTHFDDIDLEAVAARIDTPFFAYSATAIRQRLASLQEALQGLDAGICYAVKANSNLAILQLIHDAGAGADIVSAGELRRCLHAGMAAANIVFSGVGKRCEEINAALDAGIARFNVESFDELLAIDRLAAARGTVARASVRINPDVDARTHHKITTGQAANKFGVDIEAARQWFASQAERPNVRLDGLHVHIGSQLLTLEPFRDALQRVADFHRELAHAGHSIACIDVGGGLGVRYRDEDQPPTAEQYVATIRKALDGYQGRILLEPGRWLLAEAGILVSRVVRIKHGSERDFLILDAAMNDLARPALYDAWHDIQPVTPRPGPGQRYDVVGPVCESGDTFARQRSLPELQAGDLVAIHAAGAYGASMASTYNSRPLAAEVLIDSGRYAIIRQRQTFDQMIAGEQPARHWETP